MRVLFTAAFSLILLAGCSEEARESHRISSGEKGFNLGLDVDHKLSPEQIGTSFDYFDSQYEIAKKGGDVDCEGLMSKVVRLKHGRHMAESHGEFTQDVDVMDYMALTSNNFIENSKSCKNITAPNLYRPVEQVFGTVDFCRCFHLRDIST